jgi:tetratricopeptide (TPR) repeat protein
MSRNRYVFCASLALLACGKGGATSASSTLQASADKAASAASATVAAAGVNSTAVVAAVAEKVAPAAAPEGDEVSITSSSPEAIEHYRAGRSFSYNSHFSEADAEFKKAFELDPKFARAAAVVAASDGGEAERQKALELAQAVPETERTLIQAELATSTAEARRLFEQVSAAKPKDPYVLSARAGMATGDEDFPRCIDLAQRLIAVDGKRAEAYNTLAYCQVRQGRDDEAVAAAKKQVELLPNEPNALDTLGEIFLMTGKPSESKAAFQETAKRWPKFNVAHEGEGFADAAAGDLKGALASLRASQAAAASPRDAAAALYLQGWLLGGQGKVADVNKTYDAIDKAAAEMKRPTAPAHAAANRGFMLALMGKPADAAKAFAQAEERAKSAGLTGEALHGVKLNVLDGKMIAAVAAKKASVAAAVAVEIEAEIRTMPVDRYGEGALAWSKGLAAQAKGDHKGAIAAFAGCRKTDLLCTLALARSQRASGDKKGADATLAALKAHPVRVGSYLYFAAGGR